MREGVRGQVQLAGPHPDAFQFEAVHVPALRQGFRAQVLLVQARGVVVHEARRQDGVAQGRSVNLHAMGRATLSVPLPPV